MPKKISKKGIAEKADSSYFSITSENLRLSFDFINWDSEEFFIHGLTKNYYVHLFNTLSDIKKSKSDEIKQQRHHSLHPKYINWSGDSTITRRSFPDKLKKSLIPQCGEDEEELQKQFDIMTRDSFELRVAKNYGRIHGFIFDNTFHIVWFDPAHNLFPMKNDKGKVNKIKLPDAIAKIKTFCPEEINRIKELNIQLYQSNENLKKENQELMCLLDSSTSPA